MICSLSYMKIKREKEEGGGERGGCGEGERENLKVKEGLLGTGKGARGEGKIWGKGRRVDECDQGMMYSCVEIPPS